MGPTSAYGRAEKTRFDIALNFLVWYQEESSVLIDHVVMDDETWSTTSHPPPHNETAKYGVGEARESSPKESQNSVPLSWM